MPPLDLTVGTSADPLNVQRRRDHMQSLHKKYRKWEKKVLACSKLKYMKHGEATKEYHQETLPLPLLKLEADLYREECRPHCEVEELGGFEELTQAEWEARTEMPNQPRWRLKYFEEFPAAKSTYALAPRHLRIDPIYCPIRRRRTWDTFQKVKEKYPQYLNFPLLPKPTQKEATEEYFISTLKETASQLQDIPDLACQMLVKIARMILAAVLEFHKAIEHDAVWRNFLEGHHGLCYNLQEKPPLEVLMGIYARVQFCKAHMLVTFEEAFLTGFFEYDSRIFGPMAQDIGARYIAYHSLQQKNPVGRLVLEFEQKQKIKEWKKALKLQEEIPETSSSEDSM